MYFAENQYKQWLLLGNTGKPVLFPLIPVTAVPAVKKQRADEATVSSVRGKSKR